jgi:hypothetical protein
VGGNPLSKRDPRGLQADPFGLSWDDPIGEAGEAIPGRNVVCYDPKEAEKCILEKWQDIPDLLDCGACKKLPAGPAKWAACLSCSKFVLECPYKSFTIVPESVCKPPKRCL